MVIQKYKKQKLIKASKLFRNAMKKKNISLASPMKKKNISLASLFKKARKIREEIADEWF